MMRKTHFLFRILGLLYFALATLAFYYPQKIVYLLNIFPQLFEIFEPLPEQTGSLWLIPACVLEILLGTLYLTLTQKTASYAHFLHFLAKSLTAGGFIFLFLNQQKIFAYLVIAGIEILLILFVFVLLVSGRKKDNSPVPPDLILPETKTE